MALTKKQQQEKKRKQQEEQSRIAKLKREIEKLANRKVSPIKKLAKRKEKYDPAADLKYHDPCHVNTSDKVDANGPVKSIMDRMALDKEKPEVRDAIIAKSKRIGVSFNKGGLEYISDPSTLKTNSRRDRG